MAQRRSWASYAIWGSLAVCAVLAAAFTIALVVGAQRGITVTSAPKRPSSPPIPPQIERPVERVQAPPAPPAPDTAALEIARLNDALRTLAADRDRLAARLEAIERTLGDVTASIKERATAEAEPPVVPEQQIRIAAAPTQPVPPAPAPTAQPRRTPPQLHVGDPLDILRPYASVQPLVNTPTPTQTPMHIQAAAKSTERNTESIATRTEFAVDLGGDTTMDGLRALWANLKGNHGALLNGMRPLVSVREGKQPGSVELRLIAGPLANAGAAARTCASLQARGVSCQTAVFDGQRLALR